MNKPEFFVTPGYGERLLNGLHYSQAVKIGDRVVPGHSFKYVAALQAGDIGSKPHLVRIETRAGHGAGKPTDKVVEETADMWAFAAHWTGLDVKPVK